MKAKDVPTAGQSKIWSPETKSDDYQKSIKEVYHEGLSLVDKFKLVVSDKEKLKQKIMKNYSAIFLILIFGFGQKMEAQTGKIDPDFNPGGSGANRVVLSTPIQSDGKIIFAGDFTSYNGIAKKRLVRVDATGAIDPTFSIGAGFDSTVNEVVIQPDGKLIAVGLFNKYNGTNRKGIVRIMPNGIMEPATTFNPGNGANNLVCGASLQTDGKIIICGDFNKYDNTTRNRITRVNSDGTLDGSFNANPGANKRIHTTAIQNDGKIIVGGAFTQFKGSAYSGIVRLTSTGAIDATFTVGIGFAGTSTNTAVRICKIQSSDGKILVGGLFESYDGFNLNNIVRLNSDGTRDANFTANTGTGPDNSVNSLTQQLDGKIIIGGDFTSFNGTPCNHIARLNSDGSLDNTFKPSTGANNAIFSTTLQSDEKKLIIGGKFTSYDGTTVGSVARILLVCSTVSISPSQNDITCNGLTNGSATITASGGSGFTYSWSPSVSTGSIASNLGAGIYTCVATNDCANSASVTVTIMEPSAISLIAGPSSTICGGGTATLSAIASGGTGSFIYNWMPGNLVGDSPSVSPSINTTYTVTVNGCPPEATQMVTVNGICPVSTVPCGLSYVTLNSYNACKAIKTAINYRFKFYDNATNAVVAVKTQPSNYIYFTTIAGLNYGKTYKWTVSVDGGLGFGPESNNACTITFNSPQSKVPCGNSYTNLNSYSSCQPIPKATNYRFRFYDNSNNLIAEKIQPSDYIYFKNVASLDYGKTYFWTVEVEYNDVNTGTLAYGPASSNSCTITFNAPQSKVPCGNSYSNLNSYSSCLPIPKATNYRFKFYDNDVLAAEKIQTSDYIYFKTVVGLKYEKTYKWTVEVEYNDPIFGIKYGPASSSSCTITFNAPQTTVPCGNTFGINGYSAALPVIGATSYRFSFYDCVTNEAIAVKTQTSNYIYFNQVPGLIFNTTYKWTVEAEYNNGTSNVFGPPSSSLCTMNYGTPPAIINDGTNPNGLTARFSNQSIDNNEEPLLINLFPNPTKDIITVEASEVVNNIKVYSITGELVLNPKTTNEVDLSNLKVGLYIISIETENNTKRFKIIKE